MILYMTLFVAYRVIELIFDTDTRFASKTQIAHINDKKVYYIALTLKPKIIWAKDYRVSVLYPTKIYL